MISDTFLEKLNKDKADILELYDELIQNDIFSNSSLDTPGILVTGIHPITDFNEYSSDKQIDFLVLCHGRSRQWDGFNPSGYNKGEIVTVAVKSIKEFIDTAVKIKLKSYSDTEPRQKSLVCWIIQKEDIIFSRKLRESSYQKIERPLTITGIEWSNPKKYKLKDENEKIYFLTEDQVKVLANYDKPPIVDKEESKEPFWPFGNTYPLKYLREQL